MNREPVAWALDGLRKLDREQAVAFDEAVILGKRGGDRRSEKAKKDQGNNITLITRGTSPSYTLARLKRDAPELAKRVASGELSANAAAIQAGFRERSVNVPLDPQKAARVLRRHFVGDNLRCLIAALTQTVDN